MHDGHEHMHEGEGHHHHDHEQIDNLSGEEKELKTLELLLEHWVEHNDSHSESYNEWAQKAIDMDKTETADYIYEAIGLMTQANNKLEEAKKALK